MGDRCCRVPGYPGCADQGQTGLEVSDPLVCCPLTHPPTIKTRNGTTLTFQGGNMGIFQLAIDRERMQNQ